MTTGTAIGTITPSGNRVVERVTIAMTRDLPDIAVQFSRIPVHGDTSGASGYDWDRMLDAATLLSHARPDVICWNGSKGGTLGFDIDRELTTRLTAGTGVPATTAALAILDALGKLDATRIALVTPYDAEYQARCIAGFAGKGIETVSELHSGLIDNFSYGTVPGSEIAAMTRLAAAQGKPQAIIYFCTNFDGSAVAPAMEAELGIPVLDSTALGIWGALGMAGYDRARLARWGRVFSLPA